MTALEALGWTEALARQFAPMAAEGLVPGRVSLEHQHIYRVLTERGEVLARVAGRMRHQAMAATDYPAVGDFVALAVRPGEARASIQTILPRRSRFSRKVPGDLTKEQIVAANIDTVFLAAALDETYNLRRIERYLVTGWESGARPVVLLTKADLCDDASARRREVEEIAAGALVLVTSARTVDGAESLIPFLGPGSTAAILGPSGVGKSTIINRLIGRDVQRTLEVDPRHSEGRHATTRRELISLPCGGLIIDTPGLRELQLWDTGDAIGTAFAEIDALAPGCRFADCRHETEPRCAVRQAVVDGRLPAERLESYLKLRREAAYLSEKQDQLAQLERKRRWRIIGKATRNIKPERK